MQALLEGGVAVQQEDTKQRSTSSLVDTAFIEEKTDLPYAFSLPCGLSSNDAKA